MEGFTINPLASDAWVSTPTIFDLFGKNDMVNKLVANLIEHINGLAVLSPAETYGNSF
jgi:hypothetical protein